MMVFVCYKGGEERKAGRFDGLALLVLIFCSHVELGLLFVF